MCDEFGPKYQEYLDNLNMYFKLKNKYEKQWQLKKRKSLRYTENKEEGRNQLKRLQKKCIQCKKNGGTIFEFKEGVYMARCNATEGKCSLNLQIKPAKYLLCDNLEATTKKKLEGIKDNIILNKLNLLFDFENEDVVLTEFNNLKGELQKETSLLKLVLQHKYEELYSVPLLDKDYGDEEEEKKEVPKEGEAKEGEEKKEKRILKEDKIKEFDIKLDNFINNFKDLLKNYRQNKNSQFLRNAMNNYIQNILPLLKQRREMANDEMFIEELETKSLFDSKIEFKMVKNKHKTTCKEMLVDEFKVISKSMKRKLYTTKRATKKPSRKTNTKIPKKVDVELPSNDKTGFSPIELSKAVDQKGESKIKIDFDKIENLSSTDSENMAEYLDKDLMEQREADGLYDDRNVFKFYSRSADAIPGKGTAGGGETLADDADFTTLAGIRDWRKVLSNFHTRNDDEGNILPLFTSLTSSGETLNWASVEHYYHAHKFEKNSPDFFKLFTMNSKSEIATDPRKALGAGGRTGYIKDVSGKRKLFRDKSIKMDSDFFSDLRNEKVMEEGQRLKYTQDDFSKSVLLATGYAKLVHLETRRGKKTKEIPFINTMKIRKELGN
tara:strand:+ start:2030 stop:3853 length:1824 start_codon:yes stop_codon:yes gene_type:complete